MFYLTQDLFPPGKYSKTINRNAHYYIAFKNPRDKTGIRTLLLQMYPEKWRSVLRLYNRITSRPFGYVMIDVHPASDDRYRLWSHLTKAEGTPQVHTDPEHVSRKRSHSESSDQSGGYYGFLFKDARPYLNKQFIRQSVEKKKKQAKSLLGAMASKWL